MTANVRGLALGLLAVSALGGSMQAQTAQAPYVLPYNMTTFAGANAQYTVGAPCANSSLIALNIDGDGCLAPSASVGADPHDVRVDYQGFVYVADDNVSNGVIQRINPYTGQYTVYFNNPTTAKNCTTPATGVIGNNGDGAGGGCIASDLLSNSGATLYTGVSGAIRGLAVSPANDVYSAFYTNSIIQKIAGPIYTGSTTFGHLLLGVAGKKGTKAASPTSVISGVYGTGTLNQPRGVGVGPDGTVYIADSSDNNLRSVTPTTSNTVSGTLSGLLTTGNATPVYTTTGGNNVGLASATLTGPEDAQVDLYGNLIIADFGDNLVRAVYHYAKASTTAAQTSFFGISNPLVVGNIYTIAGTGAPPPVSSSCTAGATGTANATSYAGFTFTNGISSSLPGTGVPIQVRKLGLDTLGNVYIADNCAGVVYFLDAKTGGMHVVAGLYGIGQSTAPPSAKLCASSANAVGDGCPGTQAGLFPTNMGSQPDTQGNLYITDSEGGSPTASRVRKLTNGLNFAPTAVGSSATQGVLMHFGANDTVAATNSFVVPSSDFSIVGSPACNSNTGPTQDKTSDCVAQLKFTPSQPGYQTSTLTVTSIAGGTVTYRISGIGTTPALAYDPGNTTQLNAAITGAQGVVVDGQGNAYIADTGTSRVLLYSGGTTTVLIPASAGLKNPKALALGTDGSLYIADTGNSLIRKFAGGTLTTIGGGGTVPASGSVCFATPYTSGSVSTDAFGDGCPAANASFSAPAGIATDNLGNVFVADTGHGLVRQIATNGYVTVLLTNFTASAGNSSPFNAPAGLAFDVAGANLIVADSGNSTVFKVYLATTATTPLTAPPAGIKTNPVTVIAGNGQNGSSIGANGVATNSQLSAPTGVAVDAAGNVYIADTGNAAIRMVTPINGTNGGIISTVAGILGSSGTGTLGGTAAITAYSYTTNATTNVSTVTLTANSSFTAGTAVTFSGLTGATFLNNQNLSVQPGATSTQFQVQYAGVIASPPPASGTETGTASSTSLATGTLLSAPGGVAVTPLGNLIVADSGNNRLLYDSRSQVNYNFGRVNLTSSSTTQIFTAVNVGTAAATLNGLTTTPASTTFTLTGCSVSTLALGATCGLTGQFTPAVTGLQSATFTDSSASPTLPSNPSITLSGTGAQLTPTSISVVQTVPVTGNPQFGAPITLQATITTATCNTFAPSCIPSGTVTFSIDGVAGQGVPTVAGTNSATATQSPTGLTVGQHTITCTFTPDSNNNSFYSGSSCQTPYLIVVVTQGSSTSTLSFPNASNNQPQYPPPTPGAASTSTQVTFSVQVTSVPPSGVPTGTVTFYSNAARTNAIGTGTVSPTTGIATLSLSTTVDQNGKVLFDNTLLPGTYTLSCQYSGDTNYSASNCPGVTFTVVANAPTVALNAKGCVPSSLYQPGTSTPLPGLGCPGAVFVANTNTPVISVGQGSTTDVTLFITPSNTVSGTLSFACSGLPANSVCTFSPQTLNVTAGTNYPQPIYTDVTLWTDIPPGVIPTKAELKMPGQSSGGTELALMLGWPLTLLGFIGLLRFRKAGRARGLTLTALALLMVGSALTLSGCAGPGIYHPNLTPVGTSTVTITVTGTNVPQSTTTVQFTVTPGIAGQQ